MIVYLILAGGTFIIVFIFFLVIARTLNTIINQLTRLEYFMGKEYELKNEQLAKESLGKRRLSAMDSAEGALQGEQA
jgi:hypothetical protein